jgi:putative ABC transport system permease protein
MDSLWKDFRFAVRVLWNSPGFTSVALLALVLGIGANTAIFSVVNAVMLRPLPYLEPDQLVSLWTRSLPNQPQNLNTSGDTLGGNSGERFTVSRANLVDYQKANHVFSGLAGFAFDGKNLTQDGPPERLFGERVTSNYFQILGVEPVEGRGFLPEEERPGNDGVVIITHELWQRRFGSDPKVIGNKITLDRQKYRVIGIMASGFKSPSQLVVPEELSFFVPAAYSPAQLADRTSFDLNVIARLKPGVSVRQARAEMDAI